MGPGGVGKTRLALAAAAQLQARFGGRAWWVELAPVTRDDMAAQAIADAIGARDAAGLNLAESIAARVADHPALIVLDNCEHLTSGCREVADRLLTMCPRLHILATSREPLGAAGESRWPLPPLTVPPLAAPPGAWPTAELDGAIAAPGATALLAGSEAMQFFLDRARAVLPGFEITDGNAELIGQLCRRLDGLPLALELAAAKLRVMAASQVLTGLDDVFKLLVGGRQGAPVRHQTLRAALDWSYDMLQPAEQAALRRLSVFAGPFCLAAAQAVTTLGGAGRARSAGAGKTERGRARSAGAGKTEGGRARSAGAGKTERGRARSAGAGKTERGRARSAGAGKTERTRRTCSTCWPGWWTARSWWSSTPRPRPDTGCSRRCAGMARSG